MNDTLRQTSARTATKVAEYTAIGDRVHAYVQQKHLPCLRRRS